MEESKGGRKRLLGYEEKVQECVTKKKRKEKMGKKNKESKNGGTYLEGGGEEKE